MRKQPLGSPIRKGRRANNQEAHLMAQDLNSKVSRRNMLKVGGAFGLGAAVAGVPALVFLKDDDANGSHMASSNPNYSGSMQGTNAGPVVAYVRDAAKGEVVIMQGVNEKVVNDPRLVAQLLGVVEG